MPLVGGLCHVMNFDQKWPQKQMCPSLEDFVTSRTLTKCGSKNVPLVGGLCHVTDFDQVWSKNVPLVGGLYHVTGVRGSNPSWGRLHRG